MVHPAAAPRTPRTPRRRPRGPAAWALAGAAGTRTIFPGEAIATTVVREDHINQSKEAS